MAVTLGRDTEFAAIITLWLVQTAEDWVAAIERTVDAIVAIVTQIVIQTAQARVATKLYSTDVVVIAFGVRNGCEHTASRVFAGVCGAGIAVVAR